MFKTLLISSTLFLHFCQRETETITPKKETAKLTILVVESDGTAIYSETDKYPIYIQNPDGSFKTNSTGLYYSGEVPTNTDLRATINNSSWFYGTNEDFKVKNDTTITLKISSGYRWRKGI